MLTSFGARRDSGAIELSKGALRTLRTQARQQSQHSSGDWSDASRGNSIAPSAGGPFDPDGPGLARNSPGHEGEQYLLGEMHQQPYFGSSSDSIAYVQPDLASWTFGQPGMRDGLESGQTYKNPAGPSSYERALCRVATP